MLIGTRLILPGNIYTSESNGLTNVIILLADDNLIERVISHGNVIFVATFCPKGTSMSIVVKLYTSIFQFAITLC